jgi:hypothetical protein
MKTFTLYGVVAATLLSACVSTPLPPTQALQAAETAIADADRTRVADNASPELTEARTKLAAARDAVHNQDMIQAQWLAEQSRASAELASAKTEAWKAKAVNDDMQKSIDTLKQEMLRNSGGAQ